jgi:hypothetical protein
MYGLAGTTAPRGQLWRQPASFCCLERLRWRIKVGPQLMARHAANPLDVDDALGWNALPLIDGLSRDPEPLGKDGKPAGRACRSLNWIWVIAHRERG